MEYVLIILIFFGGNYKEGASVSQEKIEFKSEDACKKVEAYYSRPDVLKYYQNYVPSTSNTSGLSSRRITVDAKCWKLE